MTGILRCERACGQEGQWNKTSPGRGWFPYFRIYGPQEPAFDNSSKPEDYEEVKYKADGSIDFVFVLARWSPGSTRPGGWARSRRLR